MLRFRIASAVVGIPLAVAAACLGGWWLTVPVLALACLGLHEFVSKCEDRRWELAAPLMYAYVTLLVLLTHAFAAPEAAPWHVRAEVYAIAQAGLLFGLLACALGYYVYRYHFDQRHPVLRNASATVFGALFLGVPFAFFLLLRTVGTTEPVRAAAGTPWTLEFGARAMLLTFFCTWATDSAAYFVGRGLGRTKLTPASPNKTVEGMVGGVIGCLLAALLAGLWLRVPLHFALPLGVVLGFAGQVGDLAKSILKRDLGTKDFGALIPGHGGVLDRFDSLMLNVPLAYFVARLLVW